MQGFVQRMWNAYSYVQMLVFDYMHIKPMMDTLE
jgi:hypothetical protein